MRLTSRAAAVTLLLAAMGSLCSPAAATTARGGLGRTAEQTKIDGVVRNGTDGRGVPDDLSVDVVLLSATGAEIDRVTLDVTRGGRFTSPSLDTKLAESVVVSVTYKGVAYRATTETKDGTRTPRLTIFEPTRDAGVITIRSDTSVASRKDDDELAVLHLLRVHNRSDRTYVGPAPGARPAVLRLPLPEHAFDLRAVEGITHDALTDVDGGVASGDPLQPGETRMSYSYRLLGDPAGWALGHPVHYPTTRADVLVQPDLFVRAPGRNLGSLDFDGERYRQLEFGPLLPGAEIAVVVTKPRSGSAWLPASIGAAGVALGAVVVLRRRARRDQLSPESLET